MKEDAAVWKRQPPCMEDAVFEWRRHPLYRYPHVEERTHCTEESAHVGRDSLCLEETTLLWEEAIPLWKRPPLKGRLNTCTGGKPYIMEEETAVWKIQPLYYSMEEATCMKRQPLHSRLHPSMEEAVHV